MAAVLPAARPAPVAPANGYVAPRRRISYLIPPPPADQLPPFLALPAPHEVKQAKKGNPNPLIILADENHARQRSDSFNGSSRRGPGALGISVSSSKSGISSSSGYGASSTSSGKRPNPQVQRHPEHMLGVSALAIDTSTVIESSSFSQKRPAGILYSGGRDGLVASWELGLPFKRRELHQPDRNGTSSGSRRRYRPRWAEDPYDSASSSDGDVNGDGDDDGNSSSSREASSTENLPASSAYKSSPRLRLDTTFSDVDVGPSSYSESSATGLRMNMGRASRKNGQNKFNKGKDREQTSQLPYEQRWCIDASQMNEHTPPTTAFRQAHRGHTDWVNDILLCNLNQTVISASSDRMIRAWNPHDPHRSMLPASLGSHTDYVKCLVHSREHRWVASGGFDRRIKIWDVMESRPDPIVDIPFEASIYSLATNPAGSAIACGSPEKIIKIYDPRQAAISVARLVGHADNVRSLLISDDGRHVLSASSDATVKLWSVGMQRCLHTFSHHSDSVWSLFSSHPDLEVFYSGDRTGTVCKVDFADCGDIANEGECVVLLRNRDQTKAGSYPSANDGINRIVATDDMLLWTASGSSDICRWKDIPSRSKRNQVARPSTRSYTQNPADSAAQPILSSSPTLSDSVAPITIRGFDGPPLDRIVSNERSVAFATQTNTTNQRSSPSHTSPLLQQRASSLRTSASRQLSNLAQPSYSQSSTSNGRDPASPKPFAEPYNSPTMSNEGSAEIPSLNHIPLESLVPLFTPDDPYSRSSGYALRADGTGGVGYSASVLSLHRTNSRPLASASPFGTGFAAATPPSSGLSATRAPLSAFGLGRSSSPMPPRAGSIMEEDEDTSLSAPIRQPKSQAFLLAQQEYEDRETALDGVPLRSKPNDVIRGRHGLVRAELLNDRRTVISLDTLGEVAVWDIVLGGCIGRFSKAELRQRLYAYANSSNDGSSSEDEDGPEHADVLEYVRSQIEGEAVVGPWCTVESKTGLLTVHIDQSRAFEAEVYLDEAGVEPRAEYKADQRLNLGKWVMRNLLDGYIREQLRTQVKRRNASVVSLSSKSSTSQEELALSPHSRRPSHISLSDAGSESLDHHMRDGSRSGQPAATLAAFNVALATPAMTPALLPDASDLQAQFTSPRLLPSSLTLSSLPTIPQSPGGANTAPSTPMSAGPQSDYFSRPRTVTAPVEISVTGQNTPRAANPIPATPSAAASPALKMSKMSRFKSFGKKDAKKELLGEASAPAAIEEKPSATTLEDEKDAHLSPAERAQNKLLQAVFSHPLQPSPMNETPPIRFAADLPIMIGEEAHDAGAWATVYRGIVSRLGTETRQLEAVMPQWLLEFCLHNLIQTKDQVKIAFILEPHGDPAKAGLAELPSGNARLSATRMLRMRKACHYVAEKLQLESWKQRQQYLASLDALQSDQNTSSTSLARSQTRTSLSSNMSYGHLPGLNAGEGIEPPALLPEDEVEILCNDQIVPLNITLAACARYSYGKSGDIYLTYRRRNDCV